MFFLYIFLVLIIILLFLKIELEVVKKEDTYMEIKIMNIHVFKKYFKEKQPKESKIIKIPDVLAVNKKRFIMKKTVKFFKITLKKIEVEKCHFVLYLSDKNYITGAYILSLTYAISYALKNYVEKLDINCYYKSQNEKIKIKYHIKIKARIKNIVIALLKLIIIYYRVNKKGMKENGTASNRRFNDDCHVINRKYD